MTTAKLTLSKRIRKGENRGRYLIIKSIPSQTYLTVDRGQWRILKSFRDPSSVPEVLLRMIQDRHCPPLRSFYELILKALNANILEEDRETEESIRAIDWRVPMGHKFAQIIGIGLILFGFFSLIVKPSGIQIPGEGWEAVLSFLLLSVGLSLGYALAACVIRGHGCEVYNPRFHWRTLVPHFQVDTKDARMGGRFCEIDVALMQVAPLFFIAGLFSTWRPNLEYILLLGLFYISEPFTRSPVIGLLSALYREIRLSTSRDFLFVQNKLLSTVLNMRLTFSDRRYLLIYSFYTVGWLFLVFYSNCRIFELNAVDLLTNLVYSQNIRTVSLVILIALSTLILSSAFIGLWILLKNSVKLVRSRLIRTRSAILKGNLSEVSLEEISRRLSETLLFQNTEPEILHKIAERATTSTVKPRTNIVEEGETGDALYAVLSGRVEVLKDLPSGRSEKIAELGDGDIFGEIALLQRVPRTRSVRTIQKTTLLTLSREVFDEVVVPSLGVENIRHVIQKHAFLARIPLCRNWHPQALQRFASLAAISEATENEKVVHAGHGNQFFHIVYEGSFEVVQDGKSIATLKMGDVFGEISLLKNSVSSADVVAAENSRTLSVHKVDFLRLIGHDFLIGLQFEKISSDRLNHPIFPAHSSSFEAVSVY